MKTLFLCGIIALSGCSELIDAFEAEFGKPRAVATPVPTPLPSPLPTMSPGQLIALIPAPKDVRQGTKDCKLVTLGIPNGFLAVCSKTQNKAGACDKIKVLVPGTFGGPVTVEGCTGNKCSDLDFCGWANPDWLKAGKIERSHYCGRGPLPEIVKVSSCKVALSATCRKLGRCD